MVRYYGHYSYRQRGLRANKASNGDIQIDRELVRKARSDAERRSARAWAVLIQRVYEIDPLTCPKCAGQMKRRSEISNAILGRGIVEENLGGCLITEAVAGAIV